MSTRDHTKHIIYSALCIPRSARCFQKMAAHIGARRDHVGHGLNDAADSAGNASGDCLDNVHVLLWSGSGRSGFSVDRAVGADLHCQRRPIWVTSSSTSTTFSLPLSCVRALKKNRFISHYGTEFGGAPACLRTLRRESVFVDFVHDFVPVRSVHVAGPLRQGGARVLGIPMFTWPRRARASKRRPCRRRRRHRLRAP